MSTPSFERLGAACFTMGSALLAAYAILFSLLLPIHSDGMDYSRLVLNPSWARLTLVAFIGVVLMLAGMDALYSRVRVTAGFAGTIGFLFTKTALLLQACVLTWELLLDPVVAAHSESAFLLREGIIATDPAMVNFRWASVITIVVGTVLFGLAVYRSRQFSRTALALIAVGALVYAIGPMVSVLLTVGGVITLSVGCVLVGVRLWRVKEAR